MREVLPARVIGLIIVSIVYWACIGFVMLGQFDCIQGSADYPCPTDGERYRAWLAILSLGAAIYALLWRRVRKRRRPNSDRPTTEALPRSRRMS